LGETYTLYVHDGIKLDITEDAILKIRQEVEPRAIERGISFHSCEFLDLLTRKVAKILSREQRGNAFVAASLIHRYLYAYGSLTPLLASDALGVTDVYVSETEDVVEVESYKFGRMRTNIELSEEDRRVLVARVAKRIAPLSRYSPTISRVDYEHRTRITAAVPDVVPRPVFHFRLLSRTWTPPSYVNSGAASPEQLAYLWLAWDKRRPIMVIGPPGSGKTSLAGVIASCTLPGESLAVVQSAPEIVVPQAKYTFTERMSYGAGIPSIRMSELLERALRVGASRVIVNEILGPDDARAWANAAAMGLGAITTIHAESVEDLYARLGALGLPRALLNVLKRNMVVVKMVKRGGERRIEEIYPRYSKDVELAERTRLLEIASNIPAYYEMSSWLQLLEDFYRGRALALLEQYVA